MYFQKRLKVFFVVLSIVTLSFKHTNALENKILFKVDNEIITSIDIYNEIRFLKTFNPEIKNLSDNELFEISKNSILKIK